MIISTKIVKHADISESEVMEICSIKLIRWNYSIEEHRKWMQTNIKDDDYHILIKQDDQLIAYANLVNTSALINGENTLFKGLGNVCTIESGVGYGNMLMEAINKVLNDHKWSGILLCRDSLIKYYQKFGWALIEDDKAMSQTTSSVSYMIYNFGLAFESFVFNGENF